MGHTMLWHFDFSNYIRMIYFQIAFELKITARIYKMYIHL